MSAHSISENTTPQPVATTWRSSVLRVVFGAAAVLVLGLPINAQAQDRVVQEADRTVYRQRTVIDFTDVTLEGELKKPEGTVMMHRGRTQFDSLIQLRGDFQQELERSVDQL